MYNIPVFKQLVELLHWILVTLNDFFASLGLGPDWTWGLAIIGLTIIVRLVLFPLTWKQYSNAHALQSMQPKVRALQQQYKDDRNKLQQETMKLYQEHRVNPFASCLPLLLQLPVFLALYAAISGNATYLDQTTVKAMADAGFLWIKSVAAGGGGLGKPDPTHILLILYVVTQLISTELMLQTQTDKAQKWLMRGMPIFFVFILWNFPSGLFIYWVTTNLWTIGQQLIIRKAMKPLAPIPADPDSKKKRSRIVDALVSAQDKGDKARGERAAKTTGAQSKQSGGQRKTSGGKAGSTTGARSRSGGKTGPGGKPSATKTGTGAKPTSSKPAGTTPSPQSGGAGGKRPGRKPPPGKVARTAAASPRPETAEPAEAPETPEVKEALDAVEAPQAPEPETTGSGPAKS